MRRLEALSGYEFNAVEGEERSFMSKRWLAAEEMVAWPEGRWGKCYFGRRLCPAERRSGRRGKWRADWHAGDGEPDWRAADSNDG